MPETDRRRGPVSRPASFLPDEKQDVVVLFSHPRVCPWIIPNDRAYSYHIVAARVPVHAPLTVTAYQSWGEVVRQLGNADPWVNTAAVIPVDKRSAAMAAQLLWLDSVPVSELWFFAFSRRESLQEAAARAGARVRTVDCLPYLHDKSHPLQAIRFRDARSVATFLQEQRPSSELLTCTWLAFEGVPEHAFEAFQLQEGSDQFLFRFMARGANLRAVFSQGAGLEPCWRYTIKQDALAHESADPLYCLPAEREADFADEIRRLCENSGCLLYRSQLSEPAFLDFVQGGLIAALAIQRHY